MNKTLNIWGREFDLEVVYDVYEGESVSAIQEKALDSFVENATKLLKSSKEIEKYCIKTNPNQIGETVDNIFKYVIPRSIFVVREEKKRVVALFCDYKFDEEHGIAIVFENEKFCRIGSEDDVL